MAAKFAFFPPNPPSYKVVTDNMTRLLLLTLFPHRKNVFGTRWQRQPCSTPTATQLILARCTSSSSNSASTSALTSWGGYMMNSVITILYFNGRVYEETDGVIFEGSKKAIQIKRGISFNALKKKLEISYRFLVSRKYVALQICDDEDVETMLECFQQQNQISVLELYIEKDVVGGSMFHFANSLTSCRNNLSNNEAQPPTNVSNLHGDEDDDDDDDYLVSNSYVEESLEEDDSVDGISDIDNEVTDMIQPVRIVHPTEGVQLIENPFWNDALHYNNINWSHPDEEDICGLEMPSTFNVGQELYVGMDFDTKDAIKNALKQYAMKVHQTFKVVESKLNKYIVCCLNKSVECPCLFYMRAILSKKIDSWKVTQWGGPHTCLKMTMTQDHEKLDSDLIATCVVGMIREDPSIKVSLIQERINSEFSYKVSYKKAWLAKQKAIALEYGDWEESYAKLSSWLTHMQNHSPGSYFQILHEDFIVGNTVSREHRQFHRVFLTFGQCKETFKFCKPIIQVNGTHLYDYSGYGQSSGKPSEHNTYLDIEAANKCLEESYGAKKEDIILYGQSVGSIPTLDLATRLPQLRVVVLHSPILSGLRVLYPFKISPNKYIMTNPFKIACHLVPYVIVLGTLDEVVDCSHGKQSWELCKEKYEPLWLKGGNHCDLELFPEYIRHVKKFITIVEKSPSQRYNFRRSTDQFMQPWKSTGRSEKLKNLSNNSGMLEKLRMTFDHKERSRRRIDHQLEKARKSVDRLNIITSG
ncbi:Alpha/beta hydrolase domain-containing protein 17A [Glycine soja]